MCQKHKLVALGSVAAIVCLVFLTASVTDWGFALPRRGTRLAALVLVGCAIAYATTLFQTATNNRLLTPGIIGFDALYLLIQTVVVFVAGARGLVALDPRVHFLLSAAAMVLFAGVLYRWLFGRESGYLYLLVLVGLVFATLFGSLTAFLQMLIDPNEFLVLQDRLFASVTAVDPERLAMAGLVALAAMVYSARDVGTLDALALGRDLSINLGVERDAVIRRLMVTVALLVAVATALVGPITFLGLLTVNLAHQLMATSRHRLLLPVAVLMGLIVLVGGQVIVERLLTFSTNLTVVVNLIGGIYFLFLLLRATRA